MQLKINDILKVRKADLCLDGLTVITGENDSGKSTIGKMLFTLIKTLSNTNQENEARCAALLKKHYESLSRRMRMMRARDYSGYRQLFPIRAMARLDDLLTGVLDFDTYAREIVAYVEHVDMSPRYKALVEKDLLNMRICLENKDNRAAAITTEMMYFIESEFMNNISSFGCETSSVRFQMDPNDDSSILQIDLAGNRVKHVEVGEGDFLEDATYVESPLYLHLLDTIMTASTYREVSTRGLPFVSVRAMASYHIKDLAEKIRAMQFLAEGKSSDRIDGLSGVMDGRFVFDKDSGAISFRKGNHEIHPLNVASGIKSFGLVQMLLQTGAISPDRFLIWDEPENHLHPQWQIEFARLIVDLSAAGIPILISTHSPYFVQGIRYFSAQRKIEKVVKYYLAEPIEDGRSDFRDVTQDLNAVFSKLAAPLNDIMNVDAAREETDDSPEE